MKKWKIVNMIKRNLLLISIAILLSSCAAEWQSNTGGSNKLYQDKAYCKSLANAAAPIYICRNPLMCAPDETPVVIQSLSSNTGYFNQCMFDRGNTIK
jgi:hypothetical protein